MLAVENYESIRRAYHVEGKSIGQIAREMNHSRKTVKKVIESAEPEGYTLRKERPAPVLGPYKARINELLEKNEQLPRKQRYTSYQTYRKVCRAGCRGSVSGVHRSLWQPATHHCYHLHDQLYAGFMPFPIGLIGLLTRCFNGHKWQSPSSAAPRHRHDQHHTHPSQPKTMHRVLLA